MSTTSGALGPDDALRRLTRHPALRALPRLDTRPSFAEWERLGPDERTALFAPHIEAIDSIARADRGEIESLIRVLGNARHADAVPLLADIWRTCPVSPIRDAAGRALLAISSPEALDVLWETRADWDRQAAHMAVRARFVGEPAAGVALAEQLVTDAREGDPNAARLANELLSLLAPSTFGPGGAPGWTEPDAPTWLREDERWLDLCVHLRSDPQFGDAARQVLRYLPREAVERALARDATSAPPALLVSATPRPVQQWLNRYLAGEHMSVWRELTDLGPIAEPDIRREAERVADETMRRAAAAIAELIGRLGASGYPLRPQPKTDPEVDARLRELERLADGPVPISLASFWRVVGCVDLAPLEDTPWPDWLPSDERWRTRLDPLVVNPLGDAWYSVDEWLEDRSEHLAEVVGPLEVAIAPDRLHKVDVSGGPPYAIRLPDASADPPIRWLEGEPRFVPYLRRAIAAGGFAGVRPGERPTPGWASVIARLTRDLPPF